MGKKITKELFERTDWLKYTFVQSARSKERPLIQNDLQLIDNDDFRKKIKINAS